MHLRSDCRPGSGSRTILFDVSQVVHLTQDDLDRAVIGACSVLTLDHHALDAAPRAIALRMAQKPQSSPTSKTSPFQAQGRHWHWWTTPSWAGVQAPP